MSKRLTGKFLAAAAALSLVVLSPAAGSVQAADRVGPAGLLNCSTTTDGWTGRADCTNYSGQVVAFRAVVVCGWWPDAYGAWQTLRPGWSGWSSATCGGGSGVGSVSWQEG
ncbi:hypothetical protein [Streptomyces sp. AK02-01A]|uniref:hypothetical protein n=1 Tax=Streptomyces sp. AK02-01A TaxID=3028648 RepID=UPI0029A1C253|nr:hypothetical protein [Streptomyces sp. AK02-01A]MDX3849254.1 hypothetical protein [Streptomyces sp. AK02-01A]